MTDEKDKIFSKSNKIVYEISRIVEYKNDVEI